MLEAPRRSRLQFNKRLWNQFLDIAQPYFYPLGKGQVWIFLGLIISVLIFVISLRFFFTAGLTLGGQIVFPDFFGKLAPELVKNINSALRSYILPLCLAGLAIAPIAFFSVRTHIAGRWNQWLLLAVLLFLAFLVTGLNVVISYVFRFIDNSFNSFSSAADAVAKQQSVNTFWQFLWIYGLTLVVAIPIIVAYRYVRLKLGMYWRDWLTKNFLDRYFSHRAYYELDSNSANTAIDNPDQRITEDIRSFTRTILDLALDILTSALDLINFSLILYMISKPLTGGLVFYTVFGTAVAVFVGNKLIKINFDQLKFEADFRYGMVHVRDNAESIAFYQGEALEEKQVDRRLFGVIDNYNLLIIWRALLDVFQYGYRYFARLVPYVIVSPLFFAGKVDYGTISQSYFAFSMVLEALSVVTYRIQDISEFSASIERLGLLNTQLELVAQPTTGARIQTSLANQFILTNLTLRTPDSERTLIEDLSLRIDPSDPLLVVGASGCGKSSMMRALAGLWTNGAGSIERPDSREMLFLPQKPYMILGNLREQLMYPNLRADIQDSEIRSALTVVNLDRLQDTSLDLEQDWGSVLSLGEQQRLAFARILLNEPSYVILDEATSALDVTNERLLYELLQARNLSYISVGHRPNLVNYHRLVLHLQGDRTWQVMPATDYRFESV